MEYNLERTNFCGYNRLIKRLLLLISFALCGLLYRYVASITNNATVVETFIDRAIKFNQYFLIPYIFWYAYVFIAFIYFATRNNCNFYRLLLSINTGLIICYIIYLIFPTYVPRPSIQATDIFNTLVLRFIYSNDLPFNCMPSIHVLETTLVMIFVQHDKDINLIVKLLTHGIGVSIILSTMFLKQHYLIDVIAGISLAIVLYTTFQCIVFKEINKR